VEHVSGELRPHGPFPRPPSCVNILYSPHWSTSQGPATFLNHRGTGTMAGGGAFEVRVDFGKFDLLVGGALDYQSSSAISLSPPHVFDLVRQQWDVMLKVMIGKSKSWKKGPASITVGAL
jgi:hypothetical protein